MTQLPQPPHWRDKHATSLFGAALFGVAVIATAVVGVEKLQHGQPLTAVIVLGGAVFCACMAVVGVRVGFATSPLRATSDSQGTTLHPDRILIGIAFIMLIAIAVFGTLYLINLPRGVVDLPSSHTGRVGSPILVVLGVAFSGGGLIAFARRRTVGYLRLTPSGFELVGLVTTQVGSWIDVVDIIDEYTDKQARHPTVFVMKDGRRLVLRNTGGFAPSGAALYWMIRHYWKHPENRAELTDGRALERLRTERFVPE